MNERIRELYRQAHEQAHQQACEKNKTLRPQNNTVWNEFVPLFAESLIRECASEYNKLINGEAVVLPKDREHAEALVRVGMFYLENNK